MTTDYERYFYPDPEEGEPFGIDFEDDDEEVEDPVMARLNQPCGRPGCLCQADQEHLEDRFQLAPKYHIISCAGGGVGLRHPETGVETPGLMLLLRVYDQEGEQRDIALTLLPMFTPYLMKQLEMTHNELMDHVAGDK